MHDARRNGRRLLAALILLGGPAVLAENLALVVTEDSDEFHSPGCATTGAPPCSLRDALTFANSRPGRDTIRFAIGSGPRTISLKSPLPPITDPVVLDGTKQPGWAGSPLIGLDGSAAGEEAPGLKITAGSSVVRGLALCRFRSTTQGALTLLEKGGNRIEGNFIGVDASGAAATGNRGPGILVRSSNNAIGGTLSAARNVVSGNEGGGIRIQGAGNIVRGNLVGTDPSGARAVPNGGDGISATGGNTIGGSGKGTGNVISGNAGFGVSAGPSEVIEGNRIGTDAAGANRLSNARGGVLGGGRIGGSEGTRPEGPCSGACNLISGNGGPGIVAAAESVVQGNFIGTDVAGAVPLGNAPAGISIRGVARVSIGGSGPSARNLISGNDGPGIEISANADRIQIHGNLIGTDAAGDAALGNGAGVVARDGAHGNAIGGEIVTDGNTIAFNAGPGVAIELSAGPGNAILSNTIYGNGALGIDLGNDGVTPNRGPARDPGRPATQDFPVLTKVTPYSVEGTLDGPPDTVFTLQFFANVACDPSGYGQGQKRIAGTTLSTGAAGHTSFGVSLTAPPDQFVTATATDSAGNTSEFSPCVLPEVNEGEGETSNASP